MTRSLVTLVLMLSACTKDDEEPAQLPGDSDTAGSTQTDTDTTRSYAGSSVLKFEGEVPKNLLFLSIDTFRKDHMGAHGDKGLTPFFDTIAEQGVVLDDHFQCSDWTFGSTTCTLAGRYNIERGHIPRLNGTDTNRLPVPEGTPFLATWLGEAGYWSAIVSANDWLSANWGNTQGYTEDLKPDGAAIAVGEKGMDALQAAIANGEADDGWFLHLHHMEPHASYAPPEDNVVGMELLEPFPDDLEIRDIHYQWRDQYGTLTPEEQELLEAHLRLLYEGEIRTVDARIGVTWAALDAAGLLDDTLVVIWNDHGEQFWEHASQTHAFTLFSEENDGFAIFWAKNIVPGRYTKPTASIDLVPTILDLFGIDMPAEVTGYPIGTAPADRPIFAEALARRGGVQSVVLDGYKLHYRWNGNVTFFNREEDPRELVDLYDPINPKVIELWSHLKPMVEAMAPLIINGDPAPIWPEDLP